MANCVHQYFSVVYLFDLLTCFSAADSWKEMGRSDFASRFGHSSIAHEDNRLDDILITKGGTTP